MKIALFGRSFSDSFSSHISDLINRLEASQAELFCFKPLFYFISRNTPIRFSPAGVFESASDFPESMDFIFSIGGDGTFLESVRLAGNRNIPILGINSGRLGFLADISRQTILPAVEMVLKGQYRIENRTLLQIESPTQSFGPNNFALNEITIHKHDSSSMIKVHTHVNGEFLNTFWADGLIISTPTGSTAYSLSVGGPIVLPQSASFTISPIAPHNLTVRPIVVPDEVELLMEVEGRTPSFLVSLDSESMILPVSTQIRVRKADFFVKILKLENHSFFGTLRNKLMWGLDRRN